MLDVNITFHSSAHATAENYLANPVLNTRSDRTLVLTVSAQNSRVGKVGFETSVQPRRHFCAVGGASSFWFEALEAFRESTKVEPMMMGRGAAQNHPLWSEQDTPAARWVIDKIKITPKLTAREKAYLNAVKLLYGEGDKQARDAAYSAAMEQVYRDYPNDLDAAAFYSLSLLGLGDSQDKSYRRQAKAGAIALEIYQKNPDHPGAAHYIIHAFDDPDHAILALPAARRYASIAPEAHHARHMPSHIFLQLGMWPEAAASNESAWEASDAWMKRKNLPLSVRDYHSLHWLLYCYLQQGRYSKAEELLTLMKSVMSESVNDNKLRPAYYESNYASMAAAFVVETERWELAAKLFPAVSVDEKPAGEPTAIGSYTSHGSHGAMSPAPAAVSTSMSDGLTVRAPRASQNLPGFTRGFASAALNTSSASPASVSEKVGLRELQITGLAASMKGDHEKAIELMKKATLMEEAQRPPSGPPLLIKPTHELFGEILLRAGKPAEAAAQFRTSLLRQPNRARSLLGAARAAAQSGDKDGAVAAYATLLSQWQQADEALPELREARGFLKKANPNLSRGRRQKPRWRQRNQGNDQK